jgi:predicted metal-dependent hydrolase
MEGKKMAKEKILDPRFYKGIEYFNNQDFFEAHEVWEELWLSTFDESREFLQALIQWALSLYHFSRGNMRGARSLFESGGLLMEPYGTDYQGIDVKNLRCQMGECLAKILSQPPEKLAGKDQGEGLLRFELEPEKIPLISGCL